MAVIKPEVDINFERREMAPRFQLLPSFFGRFRFNMILSSRVSRHCPTLPYVDRQPKIQMAAHATETENRIGIERLSLRPDSKRLPQHLRPSRRCMLQLRY